MSSYTFYKEATTHPLVQIKRIIIEQKMNIITNVLVCAVFTGLPTGLISLIQYVLKSSYVLETAYFVFWASLTASILYVTHVKKKNSRIEISKSIHECFHFCRDEIDEILAAVFDKSKRTDSLGKITKELCTNIKSSFDCLKNDKVGVAIRLASFDVDNNDVYTTYGRAGLSSSRKDSTEPFTKDEGVAKVLLFKNASACAIYDNVKNAPNDEYKQTNNDSNFKEVVSMIAAPMNRKDGKHCGMIGTLFITSPKERFFSQDDVEFAKAFADTAALLISHKVFECDYAKSRT